MIAVEVVVVEMVVEEAVGVEVVGVEGLEGVVVVVVVEAGTQPLPLPVVLPDAFLCFNLRLLAARL